MRTLREWIHRLWGTLRSGRPDGDLEQELRLHLELAEDVARRRGEPIDEAVRTARLQAGGTSQAMDALRDQRGLPWLEDLRRDVAYAARALLRSPGFAATAILTLALGIGANTAIFSIIDAVILRELPVTDPGQLVILTDPAVGGAAGGLILGERDHVSFSEFHALRSGMRSFSGMFASQTYTPTSRARIDGQDEEDIRTKLVSGGYFTVLGVRPVLGSTFTAENDRDAGSAPYAVISYAYWQRRFAGARSVLDVRLRLGDADLAIVGVAPPGFLGESVGSAPDVWIPFVMQPQVQPGSNWLGRSNLMWLHAVGRLRPGTTLPQAQADADAVFGGMLRERSAGFASNPDIAANVLKQNLVLRNASRGISMLRGNYTVPLYILMAFVALVLAIACASVATLLLARAVERRKELDIRLAIGASRVRIFRQLLTESLVLSAAAGLVGSAVAFAGVRLLLLAVLGDNQITGASAANLGIRPDIRTLLFTVALCLLTVLVFGVAPAWSAARVRPARSPGLASQASARPRSRHTSAHALVAAQVALSVVLLIGAGWFVRTLRNLETADLGYSRRIAQMRVNFQNGGYERTQLPVIYEALRDRLAGIAGVRAVTYSTTGLLGNSYAPVSVSGSGQSGVAKVMAVSPDYFSQIGTPIVRGRGIEWRDSASPLPVCVVNQALASLYFDDRDPVGRYVIQGNRHCEIVGVAADAHDTMNYPASFADNLRAAAPPTYYPAVAPPVGQTLAYQLITDGDPAITIPAARTAIQSFNQGLTVTTAWTLDEQVGTLVRQERTIAQLASVVGGVALLIACVGLYGLLSHVVARRTNEIGVRMALGAQRGIIAGMILRDVAVLVLMGLAIGVPVSLVSARFVRSQVFGLGAADPQTLVAVLVIMFAVAAIAGYLPARRAARIDPLTAIRIE